MNPFLPFEWITATRFLKEGRMQTAFIVSGVTIGVAVIVFMSAMQANFLKRVLTSQPQIQLLVPQQIARVLRTSSREMVMATIQRPTQRTLSIDQWQKILQQMRTLPDVSVATPTATGSALALRGDASRAISLTGIEPDDYFKIVHLPDYIVAREPRLDTDGIVVGMDLATDLGANVGDELNVTAASGANRILTIRGIVDLGNKNVNERAAYVTLRTAQSLLDLIGGVTTIDITVKDIYAARDVAQRIQDSTRVEADSWITTNTQFFTAVQAQSTANTLIRIFVGLSVAAGIAAVLVVTVVQRSKDIGILRAMGTSRGQILRIFLLQGGLLAFIGSALGAVAGSQAVIFYHAYMRQPDGKEIFPLVLNQDLYIGSITLATLTGIAAALVPALRASNLDPVVAIRG
ncbi:ABC transporter permease [Labrys neptuniae]